MRELARQALAAKLIADTVKSVEKSAKDGLLEGFAAAGLKTGSIEVLDVDEDTLGTAVWVKGRVSVDVDEAAVLKWVEANYPERVVKTVDPAFLDRLKEVARKRGVAIDSDTGEVVPGIEVTAGEPYISLRPSEAGRDRMKALLAETGLLALGDGSDAG